MSGSARQACSADAFEQRYQRARDPWQFASSGYEIGRYRTLLAALCRPWYRRAYEPACSIGELTLRLAPMCGQLLASDIAPSAVERARERCRSFPNVRIEQADLAAGAPAGDFDLIVLSEVGYYFELDTLTRIGLDVADKLAPGGQLLAAHWLGYSADHVLHGNAVHRRLRECLPLAWMHGARHAGFRVDSWTRPTRPSRAFADPPRCPP